MNSKETNEWMKEWKTKDDGINKIRNKQTPGAMCVNQLKGFWSLPVINYITHCRNPALFFESVNYSFMLGTQSLLLQF